MGVLEGVNREQTAFWTLDELVDLNLLVCYTYFVFGL